MCIIQYFFTRRCNGYHLFKDGETALERGLFTLLAEQRKPKKVGKGVKDSGGSLVTERCYEAFGGGQECLMYSF